MTGGIIQLAANGVEDMFITNDPQITYFKTIYRRHTNFSSEPIAQYFTQTLDFSTKASCPISRNADLASKSYLVLTLPPVNFTDNITKFAWVKKIGYAIINYVEVEIGGKSIDKHYGEWLNLWYELTQEKTYAYNKMIGNINELIEYTTTKSSYTLYIPLDFWFCKSYGMALPLTSLRYSNININVQLNDFSSCYTINPTNYIVINNNLVNFKKGEYIEQNVNGIISSGIYSHFDIITNRLYYTAVTLNGFQSATIDTVIYNTIQKQEEQLNNTSNLIYTIYGKTSNYKVLPAMNMTPKTYSYKKISLSIINPYILVYYIYLDADERLKFSQSKHEYLIEQVRFAGQKQLESNNRTVSIDLLLPTKLLVWVIQQNYLLGTINDTFNYTDNYIIDKGTSLVLSESILLNGINRIDNTISDYFNYVQSYQYFKYSASPGINLYSFCLLPQEIIPTGSCNMSQIDNIQIQLNLNNIINISNKATLRAYSINYNIFRVLNGLGGIVFD
jgi:hypothetical protein